MFATGWKTVFLRGWMAILVALPIFALATSTTITTPRRDALARHEQQLARALIRAAQYVDVPHRGTRPACEEVHPPQALTTPDPLFVTSSASKVKVSFIIGTDGRVHSPLILESAGLAGDRHVLQTVRTWRYRPATCNGVPTETEGKVEFSNQ